jgi:hypothetical protein
MRGLRVLELSSTATGGGVAEMLASVVALERDLGLDAEWQLIAGDSEFFEVSKAIHNGLQGMDVELSPEQRDAYLRHNEDNARALEDGWDLVIARSAAARGPALREGSWFTSKNRPLPDYLARETVAEIGIDLTRPMLLRVSLALVGSMVTDDPEGWRVYQQLEQEVRGESDCFLWKGTRWSLDARAAFRRSWRTA